jgi:hypothetical protein
VLQIDFLPGGNAKQFLADGWSFQEPIGIWTVGTESSLSLPPAATSGAHCLSIKLFPLIHPPTVARQRFELILNGRAIHKDEIETGERRITCVVPEGLLNTRVDNKLVILHPDAAIPREVSPKGLDSRRLAVCFRLLELEHLAAHNAKVENFHARENDSFAALPGDDGVRALVLCFGRATCAEIAQILRSFPLFDAAVELRFAKDLASCIEKIKSLSDKDRTRLVAVWEQISAANNDNKVELRKYVPSSAVHVSFPHLSLNCLWPLQGHDPRLIPEPLYPSGRYPHTDIVGVQLHGDSLHLNNEDLYAAYLELSISLMPELLERWKLDESRWVALDSCCDVKVAKFIHTNFARQRLFFSPEMPCAPILIYIAEHLIGSLLPRIQLQPSELYSEFSNYVHGYQGMFYDQAPIHPYVLKAFNVPGVSLEFEYRREFSKRTFREHILDYIRWAPWFAGGRAAGE